MARFAFGVVAVVLAASACRQGQPSGDPRTPPNSPLPDIDTPEEEPNKAPPPLPLGNDGG